MATGKPLMKGGKQMKEEKKENKKEIVVLDEGIDMDALMGPDSMCCGSAIFPVF